MSHRVQSKCRVRRPSRVADARTSSPRFRTALQKHVDFFAGIHRSDTGVYDARGRFSLPRFRRLFTRYDIEGSGALDGKGLARLFGDKRTDLIGHLGSKAEFALLLHLAGEDRNGRKVLTPEPYDEATTEMCANWAGPTPWRLTRTSPGARSMSIAW
jgi:hypothetical protein